ncbi:MAG: hypothetical protein AB7K09_19905, partial [Planctomycetota bacterium]
MGEEHSATPAAAAAIAPPSPTPSSASGRLQPLRHPDDPPPGSLRLSEGVLMALCLAGGSAGGMFAGMVTGGGAYLMMLGIAIGAAAGVAAEFQNRLGMLDRIRDWLRALWRRIMTPAPKPPKAPEAPKPAADEKQAEPGAAATADNKPADNEPAATTD